MSLKMEPSFSMEDLVGGLWGGRNGMGRTDSEAAFQEFLKKIPSSTNLAGQGGNAEQTKANAPPHSQLMSLGSTYTRLPSQLIGASEPKHAPPTSRIQAQNTHDGVDMGVPEGNGGTIPFPTSAALGSLPGQSDVTAPVSPVNPMMNPLHAAQAAAATGGNPLVAAGMNYAQLAALGSIALGQANPYDVGGLEKAKERRQRRMASNRESARRSRKRKQEHLSALEDQLHDMEENRQTWEKRIADLETQLKEMHEQNARLQQENESLKKDIAQMQGRPANGSMPGDGAPAEI